jgi:hypothetical protein
MPVRYGKGMKSASCSRSVVFTAEKASGTRAKSIPPVVGGTLLAERGCAGSAFIWADLGRRFRMGTYFVRADNAAEAINDHALAAWSRRKAMELGAN